MSTQIPFAATQGNSAGQTVRRLITYTLLFALVIITATGVVGLLNLLLDAGTILVGENTSSIAQALAFTLVGGPLAVVLWWALWRRLSEPAERGSLAWGLYIAAISIVSLVTFSTALLGMFAALVEGDWEGSGLASGLVWAAVWLAHRWMWNHRSKRPLRLAVVPVVLGSAFGLIVGVAGSVSALAGVFDAAIDGGAYSSSIGAPWWTGTIQALIWAAGGAAIWAWQWRSEGGREATTVFADVVLVVLGILGATILTLGGMGTALFIGLRLAFDDTDSVREIVSLLGVSIAALGVGALVWVYHRAIALERSPSTRQASILATSGIALVAAASGLGVIVNSALGIFLTPLAGSDTRTLLLGGISALVVGGPVWWITWRPLHPMDATTPGTGRRIYLIAVFGLSAIVALITLLVIGFRLFEFVLDGGASLIDTVRGPIGLLTATALVAGYHFSVWRHDRDNAAASAPAPRLRTIGEVILVTGADPVPLVQAIDMATGATVAVWRTASTVPPSPTAVDPSLQGIPGEVPVPPPAEDLEVRPRDLPSMDLSGTTAPDPEHLVRALDGVTGQRVLVVAGPGSRLEVIPLAD